MFVANLQTLARLNGGIVEVKVIELNLHGFDLRIAAENFIQYFRRIVKGDPDVLYPPFRLEFERLLVSAATLELYKVFPVLRVHKIEVEIIDAAYFQLAFEKRTDVRFRLEIGLRQLIRKNIFPPGVSFYKAIAQSGFALSADIYVCRIEIIETAFYKRIDHFVKLGMVYFIAVHGQTHTAESEIFTYFFKHILSAFLRSYRKIRTFTVRLPIQQNERFDIGILFTQKFSDLFSVSVDRKVKLYPL